jgi:hypothetical protein
MVKRSVITTVTAASNSFKLTTVLNIRADLGLTDTSVTDDYLDRLANQNSRAASQYCNREFALQGYRDTIRSLASCSGTYPEQPEAIMLAKSPLVSVTTVTEDGTLLTAVTDYETDLATGFVYRLDSGGRRISWPFLDLVFDYKAGWTLPEQTLPAGGANPLVDNAPDLEDAVIRMVKGQYHARGREPSLMQQDTPNVGSRRWWVGADSITPDIAGILDNYRIPAFA